MKKKHIILKQEKKHKKNFKKKDIENKQTNKKNTIQIFDYITFSMMIFLRFFKGYLSAKLANYKLS